MTKSEKRRKKRQQQRLEKKLAKSSSNSPSSSSSSTSSKVINHATTALGEQIREKWQKEYKDTGGYFLRFMNGNILDCRIRNLKRIHQKLAFLHPEWKVDWDCFLEKNEILYVTENMKDFANFYKNK